MSGLPHPPRLYNSNYTWRRTWACTRKRPNEYGSFLTPRVITPYDGHMGRNIYIAGNFLKMFEFEDTDAYKKVHQ
jgi:hypothetical protein